MPVIFSKLVPRATPRTTTIIPSVAHRIKRHYTAEQGSGDAGDGVAGSGGNVDEGGEPLTYGQRVVLLEKRVDAGFDKMESWFKWAGGLIFASFGAKFVYDASTEMRMSKKFDVHGAKFEKKFDTLEAKFDKKFDTLETKFDKKFDTLETKFDKKFDTLGTKFDKKLESQEQRLMGHIKNDLSQLRLEIRNDRLNDELKDKGGGNKD